jgi:hypothetical protein
MASPSNGWSWSAVSGVTPGAGATAAPSKRCGSASVTVMVTVATLLKAAPSWAR